MKNKKKKENGKNDMKHKSEADSGKDKKLDGSNDRKEAVSEEKSKVRNNKPYNNILLAEPLVPANAKSIRLSNTTAIFVNNEGEIMGPSAEGTLGIVFYGGNPNSNRPGVKRVKKAKAIRIPRLLGADRLINFHIAEIVNNEGMQAEDFSDHTGLLGALDFFRLDQPNTYTNFQDQKDDGGSFIGFYLSPSSKYKVCLIAKDWAWPEDFENYITKQTNKGAIGELFKLIKRQINTPKNRESGGQLSFDNLVLIPDHRLGEGETGKEVIEEGNVKLFNLSRENIRITYNRRNICGWWFNLPVAIYTWMTADMQRLLTACVDGNEDEQLFIVDQLKEWPTQDWFELFKILASGLYKLHIKGAVHGDPRPANIMTLSPVEGKVFPDSFRWIDIGLGYEVPKENDGKKWQTSISPRPLGGARTTPFYAPERTEGEEYEDADTITLSFEEKQEKFVLTFFYKHSTEQAPKLLKLRKGNDALGELGRLREGDRVQVREFLFVVDSVNDHSVLVSEIFEIVLDRVLIKRSGTNEDKKRLQNTLENTSISRYRIFKQWSQATDIYGLGTTILYILFMRGFFAHEQNSVERKSIGSIQREKDVLTEVEKADVAHKEKDDVAHKENDDVAHKENDDVAHKHDRLMREMIFADLSKALKNETFLHQVLRRLGFYFKTKLDLWKKDILDTRYIRSVDEKKKQPAGPNKGKKEDNPIAEDPSVENLSENISRVVDTILEFDTKFKYVLYGVKNVGLFVQVIYFCLCCIWRQDDWSKPYGEKKFDFQPFCHDRFKIPTQETDKPITDPSPGEPAERAINALKHLISNIKGPNVDNLDKKSLASIDRVIEDSLGKGKEQSQKEQEQRIAQLIDEKNQLEMQIRDFQESQKTFIEKIKRLKEEITELELKKESIDFSRLKALDNLNKVKGKVKEFVDQKEGWFKLKLVLSVNRKIDDFLVEILKLTKNEVSGDGS